MQKITSIIRAGTTEGEWEGKHISGFYNFGDNSVSLGGGKLQGSSTSTSSLSKSLAPPEMEEAPKQGWLIFGFIISFFIALFYLIGGFTNPNAFIYFFVFGGIGAILVFMYKKRDEEYQEYLCEWLPKFNLAMKRWNRLYYCHRCDGVFLPGKQMSPVGDMRHYLFSVKD